jgi:hypothetical protein
MTMPSDDEINAEVARILAELWADFETGSSWCGLPIM